MRLLWLLLLLLAAGCSERDFNYYTTAPKCPPDSIVHPSPSPSPCPSHSPGWGK